MIPLMIVLELCSFVKEYLSLYREADYCCETINLISKLIS